MTDSIASNSGATATSVLVVPRVAARDVGSQGALACAPAHESIQAPHVQPTLHGSGGSSARHRGWRSDGTPAGIHHANTLRAASTSSRGIAMCCVAVVDI